MLSALTSWLLGWGKVLATAILNFFVDVINAAIVALVAIITTISNLLPSGNGLPVLPDIPSGGAWETCCNTLNWLFPISFMIGCFELIATAIVAYVCIAPLARWAKLLR